MKKPVAVVDEESASKPGERIKVVRRFATIQEAEQFIADHHDKEKVARGGFGIDAPEEMVNPPRVDTKRQCKNGRALVKLYNLLRGYGDEPRTDIIDAVTDMLIFAKASGFDPDAILFCAAQHVPAILNGEIDS